MICLFQCGDKATSIASTYGFEIAIELFFLLFVCCRRLSLNVAWCRLLSPFVGNSLAIDLVLLDFHNSV